MAKTKKKETACTSVLDAINKKYPGAISGETRAVDVVSTGSVRLDKALGVGGWPRGRISEVYGIESSGKTTLCLHAVAEAQKAGLRCAYIDAEHSMDTAYAAAIGVDVDALILNQPDYGEQGLEICDMIVQSGEFGLVVVDSVAALSPKAELDGEVGDSHVGLQARMMSQALRKMTAAAHRGNCAIIFINQLRAKIGGMGFGPKTTTSGGNALRYYASVRADIRRIGSVKSGETVVANRTLVKVAKNKVSSPYKECEFDIAFGTGIDKAGELFEMAIDAGVVKQSGSWFSYGETKLGQGQVNAKEALVADAGLMAAVVDAVKGHPNCD
jgi:recombination protein RecA